MSDSFNGGGFDPNGSIESNLNDYYAFTESSGGGCGGGGGKKSGNDNNTNGCAYIVYAIIAISYILSNLEAIIILAFLTATITLAVYLTHKIWTFLSGKHQNIYFRGAAKIVIGYLSAIGFFAVWIVIDDFFDWEIFWSISGNLIIFIGIILLIAFIYMIKRGCEKTHK